MQKKDLLALLEHFPDEQIDVKELIRQLGLMIKLENAEAEVERGEVLPHDEVVTRSNQWFT